MTDIKYVAFDVHQATISVAVLFQHGQAMTERLFIDASTNANWHEMITRIERAISESGGWVMDHRFFSNVSLSLNFEIPADKIGMLLRSLQETSLKLSRRSAEELERRATLGTLDRSLPGSDIVGFLHITFVHDEPDLRRNVPAVPG